MALKAIMCPEALDEFFGAMAHKYVPALKLIRSGGVYLLTIKKTQEVLEALDQLGIEHREV